MLASSFSKKDLAMGASLIKANKIGQVLFSEGTYQVEVMDPKTKKRMWPFLQLDDVGSDHRLLLHLRTGRKEKVVRASGRSLS